MIKQAIKKVVERKNLTTKEAALVCEEIMTARATPRANRGIACRPAHKRRDY